MENLDVDIVFLMPVYNEEEILETSIRQFVAFMNSTNFSFRLYVIENGSTDRTPDILEKLQTDIFQLEFLHCDNSNFGMAFKIGVRSTDCDRIILIHADHWDPAFISKSIPLLENYDLLQASKNLPDSVDKRPTLRKNLTWIYNLLLRIFFEFDGTDTTGLKAFRKSKILPVLKDCKLSREMLETELNLRCRRRSLSVKELPVNLREKRPQRDPLIKKIWVNCIDLLRLIFILYNERE